MVEKKEETMFRLLPGIYVSMAIYGMFRSQQGYNGTRFFTLAPPTALPPVSGIARKTT
jgi:hypothetical protein